MVLRSPSKIFRDVLIKTRPLLFKFLLIFLSLKKIKVVLCDRVTLYVPYLLTYLLTYLLRTELSLSREAANCAAIQKIPSNFKEPEGSSPCSQEPSTGPLS
jgi:hypothetical protein